MLQNYLVIALRNLSKHKIFSIVNIGGLAISLASCLFIFYYVYDEMTYDRSHEKAERIYRITQTFITPENTQNIRWTHQKIGPYLHRLYPQVENFVRFEGGESTLGKSKIKEKGIIKADPSVFQVFTYPLIQGNPETALEKPNSIVLSETLAKKYFIGEPLGETIDVDGRPYEVTGIMKDVPPNSDKWISALARDVFEGEETPQLSFMFDTYILLKNPEDAVFVGQELGKIAATFQHSSGQELQTGFDMQALTDLHFFHGTEMDSPKGNKANVYIFGVVSIVLMVVAVLNFINLTTVRSLERAKEVGIRKVVGAQKGQLIRQFLSESFFSVFLASVISIFLIRAMKVIFETVSGKSVSLSNESDLSIMGSTLTLLIFIILVSSFYPAWILSSYIPAKVLKGKTQEGIRGGMLRKVFTIGQFALSTALLLFLMTILVQMNFMRSADLGFSKDEILVIKAPENDSLVNKNLAYFKSEFLKSNAVQQFSIGGFASNLGTKEPFASPLWITEGAGKRQFIVPNISVDKHYPTMLQLKTKEGKSFSQVEGESVKGMAIVNESFVKLAGWKNPIGQKISTYGGEGTVIGVVQDFHFKSLHNTIEPLAIMGMNDESPDARYFFLKTSATNLSEIRVLWRRLLPDHEMEYFFLNEFFDAQYKADENLRILFLYFTLLTILISASGLLALTIYHVELRTKEIGIRKVFGAGVFSLIRLLSKNFLGVILTGTTIGIAIGFLLATSWLSGFAYKADLSLPFIFLPAFGMILISIGIITFKTYRGAVSNPIDTLKHE